MLPGESGQAAIDQWGERLAIVAADHSMSLDALEKLLLHDASVRIHPSGRVYFVDPVAPKPEAFDPNDLVLRDDIPLDQAFLLHSKPDADLVIYLDFDGHHSVNNDWGHDIQFPPFDTNGHPNGFHNSELREIIEHWRYVAEDFAPFDVDVTTEEPFIGRLKKHGPNDPRYGVRVVCTQPTDGFGDGIGGVAFLRSFDDSVDNPVFTFNKGANNGGMTSSHEAGHSLGLSHDGLNEQAYHPGVGTGATSWGPLMGAPFGKSLTQWSDGSYAGATNTEDDYAVMATLGLTFRADGVGDTFETAAALSVDCNDPNVVSFPTNLIETRDDVDVFSFTTSGGDIRIETSVPTDVANLDIRLDLYDEQGVLLVTKNPVDARKAKIVTNVPAGTYYFTVDGTDRPPRYTDYGSIGAYEVSIHAPPPGCACPGDVDGDGDVDLSDLSILLANFGEAGATGDLDGDGTVDLSDLAILLAEFDNVCA
ncbi:MAG: hypothetical protein D6744_08690 [Planctomycetota bacterium]|nr:MAG: hypothetical protein D6744_08690 [Planctomycetota bacterium]